MWRSRGRDPSTPIQSGSVVAIAEMTGVRVIAASSLLSWLRLGVRHH